MFCLFSNLHGNWSFPPRQPLACPYKRYSQGAARLSDVRSLSSGSLLSLYEFSNFFPFFYRPPFYLVVPLLLLPALLSLLSLFLLFFSAFSYLTRLNPFCLPLLSFCLPFLSLSLSRIPSTPSLSPLRLFLPLSLSLACPPPSSIILSNVIEMFCNRYQ